MGYLMGSSPKTSGKSCSCRHLCRHVATFSWLSKLDLATRSQDCGYNRESLQQQQQKQEQQELECADGKSSCLFLGLQHWYTLILYVSWIEIEKVSSAISQGNPVYEPSASWIPCQGRPRTSSVWLVSVTCLYPTYLSNLSLSIV